MSRALADAHGRCRPGDCKDNEDRGSRDEGRRHISPVASEAWSQHQGNDSCVDDAHRRREDRRHEQRDDDGDGGEHGGSCTAGPAT